MSIEEKETAFIKAFNGLEDWMFQFDYLLMRSSAMLPVKPEERTAANSVRGCQSQVWIIVEGDRQQLHLRGDSYSLLMKGILAVLIDMLDGHSAREVLAYEMKFPEQTCIGEQLSAERTMGLTAMLEHIKNRVKR